jgi:hypothetical protein
MAARELAGCELFVTDLIARSHERLNGHGFPQGLSGAGLSAPQRALSFAEAVSHLLCDARQGAQRVAVASRLVPGEFDALLVGRAHSLARASSLQPEAVGVGVGAASTELPVGLALRHQHAELSRAIVILSLLYGKDAAVVESGGVWLSRLQPLMHALRSSGIEDALAHGREIQPTSAGEADELSAMHAEIACRVHALAHAIEDGRSRSEALAASGTVTEVVRLLKSACSGCGPAPATFS